MAAICRPCFVKTDRATGEQFKRKLRKWREHFPTARTVETIDRALKRAAARQSKGR